MAQELATFGGGCFWCTEAVFEQVKGVDRVVSGYEGGHVADPTYEQVCGKRTGHAEVIQISFDSETVSYRELLDVFFATHDPTTPDQQGNDVGPQYRSVIFTHTAKQEAEARDAIAKWDAEKVYSAPIVTQVLPAAEFYAAEDYHQGYYRANPGQGYCAYVVGPKVAKFRAKFAGLMK